MTDEHEPALRPVTVQRIGAVGVIELSRPEKFNAMTRGAFAAIAAAVDEFEGDDAPVRAILVRAQGRHFCTGGDLDEARELSGSPAALDDFLRFVGATLRRLEDSPLPVVAACHGLALAGGLEIALAADVVFAASDARFGDQHAQYGLVAAWGATQRLTQRIGLTRSLDLQFTGRWIDAPTAHAWGLVTYVTAPDALHDEAMAYCATLATRSRPGLAAMKRLSRASQTLGLDEGLRLERESVVEIMQGPDPAEGIAAFRERREPRFEGR
ncbi:enoyl-CoA hydratase/isomerase family protein [Microbacterium sp. No. 7]|uniref:enoyl-CoA hydratase/isomerase family protein n=1 Tax=Microbacterium sp. No. 7 TaxID=1714373 RepID=UPI0006D0BE73|nr:enoyl-CoA hydratase/isomerase family protein [Microbacterium sp. No. 7]ALJ20723.1 enoyl-CoA hydratase [Microbacterium sp. No. 7]